MSIYDPSKANKQKLGVARGQVKASPQTNFWFTPEDIP